MHRKAVTHLKRADPILARVIERVGPCRFEARASGSHFDAVMRAIVYQQLSGTAAFTIHSRLLALYGGETPAPAALLATPEETLTRVKGVGLWTAQMFLMFRLGRPNVLPVSDLGIRKAIQRAYRLRTLPSAERIQRLGARWEPYRTIACWYLWRSLDENGATGTPPAKRQGGAASARKGRA